MSLQSFTASQDTALFTMIDKEADHLTVKIEVLTIKATLHELIDSDATVNFVSFRFVQKNNLTLKRLHASAVRDMNNKILAEAPSTKYY